MPTITTKSISLSGTPDYSTLQAWEDASPANLVTADEVWLGEISLPGDVFTGSTSLLTMAGSTTDATRYKHLTTASGASFIDHADVATNPLRYDSTKGAAITSSGGSQTVDINEAYSRVTKLQIQCTRALNVGVALTVRGNAKASQCILSSTAGVEVFPFQLRAATAWSMFAEQRKAGAERISRIGSGASLYNSTLVAPDDLTTAITHGVQGIYAVATLKNVAVFGATTFDTGTAPTCTTCASDAASLPSGVTLTTYDTTTGSGFLDIDDATRDYQLGADSALIDAGTYDATNAPNDIIGTAFGSGTTPIGCWQYVAAAVGGNPYYYYAQQ